MRLLFIRHGDPDYTNDCLTEDGRAEAALLAQALLREKIDHYYVSPLGRARETASYTICAKNKEAGVETPARIASAQLIESEAAGAVKPITHEWLREFGAQLNINGNEFLEKSYPDTPKNEDGSFRPRIAWDMTPAGFEGKAEYFHPTEWRETEVAKNSDLVAEYDRVTGAFDALLKKHGYEHKNGIYRTEKGNEDTLAFFCHFGVTGVLLSHIWGTSPFLQWQMMAAAPTSVTEVFTEEREKGFVSLRMTRFGDISHLYGHRAPSFSARFCETYEREDQRH